MLGIGLDTVFKFLLAYPVRSLRISESRVDVMGMIIEVVGKVGVFDCLECW